MHIEIPNEVYQVFVRKHGEGVAEAAIRAMIYEALGAVNKMAANSFDSAG